MALLSGRKQTGFEVGSGALAEVVPASNVRFRQTVWNYEKLINFPVVLQEY